MGYLRILHTEGSDGWGGQEIRILSEMDGLLKRGHRLFLIATPQSQILKRAKRRGITTEAVAMDRYRWPAACMKIRRFIREHGIDVVNTHSSSDSWIASVAARLLLKHRPLVVRTRHLSTPISLRWLSRILYDVLPDGIMTTGEAIKQNMVRKNHFREERIISVPTGVDLARFGQATGLRETWGIPRDVPVVGTIGVLRSWKGHRFFIQAAQRVLDKHPSVVFLIVGDGPGRLALETEIKSRNLKDRVRMVGYCEEVERAFATLDLFVLASTGHEGVPQVILQALAMGKPVVATHVGSIPEVVRAEETGDLVPPGNPVALAEAISAFLSQPDRKQAMARRGQSLVASDYGLQGMLDRVERFYGRLLDGKTRDGFRRVGHKNYPSKA